MGLLSAADLRADLDVLERAYRTLHPGLVRYNTAAEVDRLFAVARRELSRSQTREDAYLALSRLTAAFHCGHSYPNPSNQTEELATRLRGAPRLPFLFRWRDGAMVVTRDFSGALGNGARIERVGGLATRDMLGALLPLARADGRRPAARIARLNVTGAGMQEAFDVLAPLVFPAIFARPRVDVVVGGRTVGVALQSASDREASLARPDGPLWRAERLAGDVVYVKMPTWVAYKSAWDWKASLDEIAGMPARALVLDLRGNEGGSDVGRELVAHLIDAPLAPRSLARRVRFASVPGELRPFLDTWDPSFFELGATARDAGAGWRELDGAADAIVPRAPRFRGKLIVLVDDANTSATSVFAELVQRARLGTLVGVPTGGNLRGINGGAFFFLRLPRTRLEVDLPLIATIDDGAPDAGVTPDVVVDVTPEDLAAGRDPQLARALELAAR